MATEPYHRQKSFVYLLARNANNFTFRQLQSIISHHDILSPIGVECLNQLEQNEKRLRK